MINPKRNEHSVKLSCERIESAFNTAIKSSPLKGKNIVVTGANGALGHATSLKLAELGATVILLGRNVAELEKVYDEIVSNGGAQPAIYPMHLENLVDEEYTKLASTLLQEFSALDGLVLCANHFDKLRPLEHLSIKDFQKYLSVNVSAPFSLEKSLSPLMRKDTTSAMIAVIDEQDSKRDAFWGAYKTAKSGLGELWRVLAVEKEHQTHLRYRLFDPGALNSALRVKAYPAIDPSNFPDPINAGKAAALICAEEHLDTPEKEAKTKDPLVTFELSYLQKPNS